MVKARHVGEPWSVLMYLHLDLHGNGDRLIQIVRGHPAVSGNAEFFLLFLVFGWIVVTFGIAIPPLISDIYYLCSAT